MEYKIIEIFNSIDGEGRRAGELTTFIRLSGCNLSCSWCDTVYSHDGSCGEIKSLDNIMDEVEAHNCRNITLTGGEPLIHKNVDELILKLIEEGYDVNVETNGTVNIGKYINNPEFNNKPGNVWFTIDYKAKSSGMNDKMNIENFYALRDEDVLKFVVGSYEELYDADNFLNELREHLTSNPYIYFSPVFGMIEPVEIVKFMQSRNYGSKVRVQLQLHKLIWDKNMRSV